MSRITFKKNGTFSLPCTFAIGGALVDLTNYTITSRIALPDGTLVADLTPTKAASQSTTGKGLYTLSHPTPSTWPSGTARCDIVYNDGAGTKIPTYTFEIQIDAGITP